MAERKLTPEQSEKLGNYVYVYYDKDTRTPFYIGRGQGNRVFSHEKGSHNEAVAERIAKGNYGVDFLAHGLDFEGAQKVEAAAIDLIGIDNLKNKSRGTDSRTFGRIDVDDLLRSVSVARDTSCRPSISARLSVTRSSSTESGPARAASRDENRLPRPSQRSREAVLVAGTIPPRVSA